MSEEPKRLFPSGNGDPDCPDCLGRGVVEGQRDPDKPFQITPPMIPCHCTLARGIMENIRKGWRPLCGVKAAPAPELLENVKNNIFLTASDEDFKTHLRWVVNRQHKHWFFKVYSDSDLMNTWLQTAGEVFDQDIIDMRARARVETRESRLYELVEPYELLVIRLGVKTAANRAMPDVLLEAIRHREMKGKPTWLVDSPDYRFGPGMVSWDEQVQRHIEDWPCLRIEHGVRTESMQEARRRRPSASDFQVEAQKQEDPFHVEGVEGQKFDDDLPPELAALAGYSNKESKKTKKNGFGRGGRKR